MSISNKQFLIFIMKDLKSKFLQSNMIIILDETEDALSYEKSCYYLIHILNSAMLYLNVFYIKIQHRNRI